MLGSAAVPCCATCKVQVRMTYRYSSRAFASWMAEVEAAAPPPVEHGSPRQQRRRRTWNGRTERRRGHAIGGASGIDRDEKTSAVGQIFEKREKQQERN